MSGVYHAYFVGGPFDLTKRAVPTPVRRTLEFAIPLEGWHPEATDPDATDPNAAMLVDSRVRYVASIPLGRVPGFTLDTVVYVCQEARR